MESISDAPWRETPPPRYVSAGDVRERCRSLPPTGQHVHAVVAEPRLAALLVPIVEVDGQAAIVATKRPSTMRHHRGDWVFPGGAHDPERDRSSLDTARNELYEELGIAPGSIEIVGQLASHGPIRTGFTIDVFVGIVRPGATISPDPHEVAEVVVVPVSVLAADDAFHVGTELPDHDEGPIADGVRLVPDDDYVLRFFELRPGEYLWGTQVNIVHELLCRLYPPVAAPDVRHF